MRQRRAELIAVAFLLLVALLFCGRAVFTGRALLPLDMLLLMPPWQAHGKEFVSGGLLAQNQMLDPVQQYYPWRSFAVSALKDGIIPLWNPYSYSGQPFLANLQSALFYPPNLIFLIMSLPAAFTWGVVLHLFLAGLFCYALLRQWRLSPLAAVFGAVVFMLNGYLIGWLEYPAFGLWVLVWLPALLLCYEKAAGGGGWPWYLLTGLVVGLQFLGGQLQIAAYLMLAFLLYAVWRALASGERDKIAGRLVGAATALGIGLALAAVQLLPTFELAPLSGRAPKTFEQAREFALPLSHLILFWMPNFFGSPAQHTYWGNIGGRYPINFLETGCYVGLITLLLAWLGLRLRRKPAVGYLLALAIISLLFAIGSPLFALFFYLVPGAKQLAGLARLLCLTDFALAGLAAFGLQRLLEGDPPLRRWELPAFALGTLAIATLWLTWALRWADFAAAIREQPPLVITLGWQGLRLLFLLLLSLLAAGLLARRGKPTAPRRKAAPQAKSWPVAAGLLACAILLADIFSFGVTFNPATDPKLAFFATQTTDYLRDNLGHARMTSYAPADARSPLDWMPPNTALAYRLREVHGYDSLAPGRYTRLSSTDWGKQGTWPAPDSKLADLLGISYAFTTAEISAPGWELAQSNAEGNIYHNREALPRAFIVPRARRVSEEESLQLVKSGGFDPRAEVLLPADSGRLAMEELAAPGQNQTLDNRTEFVEDGINSIRLTVQTAAGGWLVLADTAYPGWQVTIDGRPAQWETADYVLRAVKLPAGRSSVEWSYQPASFKVGLFITLAALAGLCAALGGWRFAGRRAG